MARHYVGTSGWSYENWSGLFYPEKLKQRDRLPFYADHLPAVEINASFYRLPFENMLKAWRERTPEDFVLAVKAWRRITHHARLADCAEAVQAFHDRIATLGDKAGPVLYQLPPRFPADPARLDAFLAQLPGSRRAAIEFRDASWHDAAVYEVLRRHNAAFVPFDLAGEGAPRAVTADFVYVRLHGHSERYRGSYSDAQLRDWADWLGGQLDAGRDAYVFFDNTDEADHAVRNALDLDTMLRRR